MRNIIRIATCLLSLAGAALSGRAIEMTWEFSVQVSAAVQQSPAQINLSWPQDQYMLPNSYSIYRKALGDTSWGAGVTVPGTSTSYTDSSVQVGQAYEYKIVKSTAQYTGYGYIYAGINVPMTDSRGKLLLLVDNTFTTSLSNELARLQQDLVGDGWTVIRQDVSRNDSAVNIKNLIKAQYNADPANVNAVFLFGHVPVPYSGNIVPDGHTPDHQGAWPCDGYYGDMDGTWSDSSVNVTGQYDPRNSNVPGDGKFDQSTFPAPIKLMVGRVDLANMPGALWNGGPSTFPSELELLRNYLNKDHKFRTKQFDLPRRGIVGDFFGVRSGEAFAASGWRNFSTFFGASNVDSTPTAGTWTPMLHTNSYLWAYGCGAGSFTSIAGLGNSDTYNDVLTRELWTNDVHAVFTLLFGSWLGDWDSQDNIMRGVLALPTDGLTCAWSGRPHWFMQHMALGMPIGYSARLTQNNGPSGLYQNQLNSAAGQIHIALLGDPTLRMHIVAPPGPISAATNGASRTLSWTASADSVLGYHVYRATGTNGFSRLTPSPVAATSYTDTSAAGAANYMVRAVKLETSASGTYYNPSAGSFLVPLGGSGGITNNPPPTPTPTNGVVVWVDDALPAGAVPGTDGGDSWNWVASNPTPISGTLASQSTLSAGLHQHFFTAASQSLTISTGDVLNAYVYLDPANPPTEVMLQWNNGSWEHRAYWGADNIAYGAGAQGAGHLSMGALPTAGRWVLLSVPASRVGLEGSTITGMSFSQFDGRATWDKAGKNISALVTPPPGGGGTNTNNPPPITNAVAWVDDALPTGAVPGTDGGDAWNWISSNPAPYSGTLANQSTVAAGLHQHFFTAASQTLTVNTGDVLYAYVYLDPANPPTEVMLQWNDGSWEHRAYWGADSIAYGAGAQGASHLSMGALPATGQWVLLSVPAGRVGLEGSTLNGMSFSQFGGRATWDNAGKSAAIITPPPGGGGGGTNTNNPGPLTNVLAWVDDTLPTGAVPGTDGNDVWNWTSSNPAPYSGAVANQSTVAAGLHQHFFTAATQTLSVNTGDVLFAYVYLDPAHLPSEVMLQWNNGSWEHRAYWGADNIGYGSGGAGNGHAYIGPLPAAGQWALLSVPASQVGLEGSTLNGMAFSQFDGRATWDLAGKGRNDGGTNPPPPITITNQPPTNLPPVMTNTLPGVSYIDYLTPQLPSVGDNGLHVLTPTLLELKLINTKDPDPAQVAQWNFVNNGNFTAPPVSAFNVLVNGQVVAVTGVGFKRRPLYAPYETYDLRIENSLYLQLAAPVSDNQSVQVLNPGASLWPATTHFSATANPLRYSPAIHVNQEGYMPNYSKKAMVGYYLGSLGEMPVQAASGFKIVDANTGTQVFQGSLVQRQDSGYTYTPTPYQQVYEADFTGFNTPGEYRLVVPGMGGSLPFMIHDGVAMAFARAYELGLYHQRCGTNTAMPCTRFEHGVCHAAPAAVPASAASYPFTWTTVSNYSQITNPDNPVQTAPALTSPAMQLFPYVNQGPVDVSGGHHDAGDYSKYTINSASLIHYLMFAVDSLPGAASLDNLGIPESGDGISDIMQEAKWEADFLAKMQDRDGGFYFLVYPQNREYEGDTPDHGDPQVVWPKTTSVTAASVAALAQCASSPLFRRTYPDAAATYLQKARLGWQFLTNAINRYGKNGGYQKITHYGDNFADRDELAWAACQIFLATGDTTAHQLLLSWFDPSDPATWRWGWWHMSECYGHAIRSYAFAVQSGRATANQLDATFLGKCQAQIAAAANDVLSFSQQNAYGTSFPVQGKAMQSAGWYFSADQAFDLAVAYQLNPSTNYLNAMLANMNYEGGCNPVNVSYVTGLGWKRTRDIVSGWAAHDTRVLPPSGIPVGNIQANFSYLWNYGPELEELCFPSDGATTAPYPFYDRWGDSWNVSTEMVVLNQARGLGMLAFLAAQGPYRTQAWQAPANASLVLPATVVPVGSNVTATMLVPGMDLSGARVTWEARDQDPAYGATFTFTPRNNGTQWVEAEAQWPDGRRVFAKGSFIANSPNIVWVEDAIPAGATPGADGGDSWNWVGSNPPPFSGSLAHLSALASGEHQHFFSGANATLSISTGDVLYAYVYLDPANPPSEVMLQWNNGTNWDHRAYWGGNTLDYGLDGTASRRNIGGLPIPGQWVQLRVPAASVGLEGATLTGMAFTCYNGRCAWDAAGRLSTATGFTPVSVPFNLRLTSTGATLTWTSIPNHLYEVRSKNNLTDPWTTIARFSPTNTTTSWTDTRVAQRYYEVMQDN
jgi:hypothetical protein